MAFQIRTEKRTVTGPLDPTVFVLEDTSDGSRAEVWPALGFNCYRWHVAHRTGPLELLYADPALFANGRPTRSGIPVLFPFPNRIRDGKFSWAGKAYQLPLNDPVQKNAIHGFACRVPWRVVDQGANSESAWVTGAFRCSVDAPDSRVLWPADHEITLTYRLGRGILRIEAVVTNPDSVDLPFGLGYHPYFRLPFSGSSDPASSIIDVPAAEFWELDGNLPTGTRRVVDAGRDLNKARKYGELQLDDVLTGLPARAPRIDGLIERAAISSGEADLRVFCAPAFREIVVFTPPHRQAFCVEPYTCTTDAINLQGRGVESGWLVLSPGKTWSGTVELWV